jgi:hypothetical protein
MATTTNRYLSYPALATGISKASSGSTAWSLSTWTEVVPVSTITSTFYIAGICWGTDATAAVDTTHGVIIELGTGTGGSEVMILQVPSVFRIDSAVGHMPSFFVIFPEPKQVAANERISVRVAQSLATTVVTYAGINILYQIP